jgi:hypothetical protein
MGRKRKADIEEEAQQLSQQVTKIRNPHVHKSRLRTVGDAGTEVRTTISGRDTIATDDSKDPAAPAPTTDDMTSNDADAENSDAKKRTQVLATQFPHYIHHSHLFTRTRSSWRTSKSISMLSCEPSSNTRLILISAHLARARTVFERRNVVIAHSITRRARTALFERTKLPHFTGLKSGIQSAVSSYDMTSQHWVELFP